jgi:hypothetical protein
VCAVRRVLCAVSFVVRVRVRVCVK